ncbi:hypothetical protein ACHIPZ_13630 [Antrihabitans sp. NCIMB 15449]|uniref:Uncharacterized protein n=1 Tax=Antrihabitans spumae TaxID=3373370 RepID=A0ABW7JMM8_9NOCA
MTGLTEARVREIIREELARTESPVIDIHEVSRRTGHSEQNIRRLRSGTRTHELFSRMWKQGDASCARLVIEAAIVDAWVEAQKSKTRRSA